MQQQLSGGLVSDDLGGEDAGCGGPGLVWLHVVCGCEAGLIPLCARILYFDAAKLSIKQFSLIYFTVSVFRQWDEYEKVIEKRPIKTT